MTVTPTRPTTKRTKAKAAKTVTDESDSPIVHVPAIIAKKRPANAIEYRREVVDVTPSMALSWLGDLHENQRSEKPGRVDMYAEDMRRGRWREDTEIPIIFDWHHNLIDGQNRLRAVVEANKTVKFVVVWGVDPDVMAVVDTGAARTVVDAMRITGRGANLSGAELNVASAIARRAWHWEAHRYLKGSWKAVGPLTHSAVGQKLDEEKDIVPAALAGIDAAKSTRPAIVQGATYGFLYLLLMRIDSVEASRFHGYFISPEDLPGGSPILAVRERLFRAKLSAQGINRGTNRAAILDQDEQLALMIKAWNLFLADRPAPKDGKYLIVSKGQLTNNNFPMPMNREEAVKYAAKLEQKGVWRAGQK